jgi:hypothetical protein
MRAEILVVDQLQAIQQKSKRGCAISQAERPEIDYEILRFLSFPVR